MFDKIFQGSYFFVTISILDVHDIYYMVRSYSSTSIRQRASEDVPGEWELRKVGDPHQEEACGEVKQGQERRLVHQGSARRATLMEQDLALA